MTKQKKLLLRQRDWRNTPTSPQHTGHRQQRREAGRPRLPQRASVLCADAGPRQRSCVLQRVNITATASSYELTHVHKRTKIFEFDENVDQRVYENGEKMKMPTHRWPTETRPFENEREFKIFLRKNPAKFDGPSIGYPAIGGTTINSLSQFIGTDPGSCYIPNRGDGFYGLIGLILL